MRERLGEASAPKVRTQLAALLQAALRGAAANPTAAADEVAVFVYSTLEGGLAADDAAAAAVAAAAEAAGQGQGAFPLLPQRVQAPHECVAQALHHRVSDAAVSDAQLAPAHPTLPYPAAQRVTGTCGHVRTVADLSRPFAMAGGRCCTHPHPLAEFTLFSPLLCPLIQPILPSARRQRRQYAQPRAQPAPAGVFGARAAIAPGVPVLLADRSCSLLLPR